MESGDGTSAAPFGRNALRTVWATIGKLAGFDAAHQQAQQGGQSEAVGADSRPGSSVRVAAANEGARLAAAPENPNIVEGPHLTAFGTKSMAMREAYGSDIVP